VLSVVPRGGFEPPFVARGEGRRVFESRQEGHGHAVRHGAGQTGGVGRQQAHRVFPTRVEVDRAACTGLCEPTRMPQICGGRRWRGGGDLSSMLDATVEAIKPRQAMSGLTLQSVSH
jgi:hypothetical protein